ncbi:hypothetical protein CH63R_14621 [Colletotrichum higginsianum IMI 349063]|uniref:Uncharacterized protein n=1 Tax=Colletotrichum higginsianum (strain IMI 349063) TaxID=759273 RepID=A0A1B7XQL2_COLHI|nr:hypothetical protein CH63R_14621 [Colletotrichum higginsianum IMI 349063]OBR02049.1 hypothetical protein CH63R_14621 [Colletotrichum higginsianum IMI 349063]
MLSVGALRPAVTWAGGWAYSFVGQPPSSVSGLTLGEDPLVDSQFEEPANLDMMPEAGAAYSLVPFSSSTAPPSAAVIIIATNRLGLQDSWWDWWEETAPPRVGDPGSRKSIEVGTACHFCFGIIVWDAAHKPRQA